MAGGREGKNKPGRAAGSGSGSPHDFQLSAIGEGEQRLDSGQTCGNVGPPQGEEGGGDPSVTAVHPSPRTPATCCPAFSRGRSLLPVGRVQGYSLAGSSWIKKVLGW